MNPTLLTIFIIALATAATRFIPFIAFPSSRKPPQFILFLGQTIPRAAIALLVVYALKDAGSTSFATVIAIIVLVLVHMWRRNSLLTIFTSTAVYMILVQFVF